MVVMKVVVIITVVDDSVKGMLPPKLGGITIDVVELVAIVIISGETIFPLGLEVIVFIVCEFPVNFGVVEASVEELLRPGGVAPLVSKVTVALGTVAPCCGVVPGMLTDGASARTLVMVLTAISVCTIPFSAVVTIYSVMVSRIVGGPSDLLRLLTIVNPVCPICLGPTRGERFLSYCQL